MCHVNVDFVGYTNWKRSFKLRFAHISSHLHRCKYRLKNCALKEKANQLCGQFNRMHSKNPKSMSARGNRASSLIGKIDKTQFNCIVWIEILLISSRTTCCLKIYHLSLSSWIFMYKCFLLTYGNRRNQPVHLFICCRKWKSPFSGIPVTSNSCQCRQNTNYRPATDKFIKKEDIRSIVKRIKLIEIFYLIGRIYFLLLIYDSVKPTLELHVITII